MNPFVLAWRRTPPGYRVMVPALVLLLLYLGFATPVAYGVWGNGYEVAARFADLGGLACVLTALAPAITLVSWRWAVLAASGIPTVLLLLGNTHQWPATVFLSLVAVALVRQYESPRHAWLLGLGSVVAPVTLFLGGTMVVPDGASISMAGDEPGYAVITTALFLAAVAVVLVLGEVFRRRVLAAQAGRAALSRAGQVEEQSAVLAERSRLARDLHDVVAHHVSLIAVRAETAPYTHPTLDDRGRAVLVDIAADARLALDELRGVLGILGRSGDDPARVPQPGWADLAALVERARASGAVVIVEGDNPGEGGRSVPPSSGYVAYRVVQEALTNARKHAAGRPVTISLTNTGHVVVVRVGTPLRGDEPHDRRGHGLIGMRERVEALGGSLRAGPDGDRFVVEATLPGEGT